MGVLQSAANFAIYMIAGDNHTTISLTRWNTVTERVYFT